MIGKPLTNGKSSSDSPSRDRSAQLPRYRMIRGAGGRGRRQGGSPPHAHTAGAKGVLLCGRAGTGHTLLRGFGAGIKGKRKEKERKKREKLRASPAPAGEPEGVSPTFLTHIAPAPLRGRGCGGARAGRGARPRQPPVRAGDGPASLGVGPRPQGERRGEERGMAGVWEEAEPAPAAGPGGLALPLLQQLVPAGVVAAPRRRGRGARPFPTPRGRGATGGSYRRELQAGGYRQRARP